MYNQYDPRWKNHQLGNGKTTLGTHGCNVTCLAQGLTNHGHNYTPGTLNALFKQRGSYSRGSDGYYNLLDPANIAAKHPEIFVKGWTERYWSDANAREYILNRDDLIVIGEVDARGIGGSGQHFVLVKDFYMVANRIRNTYIGDPWGGIDGLVTDRYNSYGNIKGFRIYQVKQNNDYKSNNNVVISNLENTTESEDEMKTLEFLGCKTFDEAKSKLNEHLGEYHNVCDWGTDRGDGTGGHLGSERRKVKKLEAELQSLQNQDQAALKAENEQLKTQVTTLQSELKNVKKDMIQKFEKYLELV